jgi:hypothetical protein
MFSTRGNAGQDGHSTDGRCRQWFDSRRRFQISLSGDARPFLHRGEVDNSMVALERLI